MPLPYASSLCGACADVCPVRIPIPELLVYWRERAVEAGLAPKIDGLAMRAWATMAEHPTVFGSVAGVLGRVPLDKIGRVLPVMRGWVDGREAPEASDERFLSTWSTKEEGT
jgi:L-lactate dehydrogenase complex protein LldF